MNQGIEESFEKDQAYESLNNVSHMLILSISKKETFTRTKYNMKKQLSSLPIITKKVKEN